MTEVVAALLGVVVGAAVGYFSERSQRRADRRADAYIEALATLQTARDVYGRMAGVVGHSGGVEVAPDHDLNRVAARLEYDGSAESVEAYRRALQAASEMHAAMLRPVREAGDPTASAQYLALKGFGITIMQFADETMPRRRRRRWPRLRR